MVERTGQLTNEEKEPEIMATADDFLTTFEARCRKSGIWPEKAGETKQNAKLRDETQEAYLNLNEGLRPAEPTRRGRLSGPKTTNPRKKDMAGTRHFTDKNWNAYRLEQLRALPSASPAQMPIFENRQVGTAKLSLYMRNGILTVWTLWVDGRMSAPITRDRLERLGWVDLGKGIFWTNDESDVAILQNLLVDLEEAA